MTNKKFIEESIRHSKDGAFKFVTPISDFGKVAKFGSAFSLGGMLELAKRRALAQNPILPNAADIVNWVVYDTYKVAANTSIGANYNYFTQPIGTNSKTKMDTNLEQVQRLPDPQWMNVIAMGFQFGPEVILADIIKVVNNYYNEFWVGGKVYVEGRHEVFPSGTGISGFSTANSTNVVTNGQANWNNLFDLRLPPGINLGVQTNPDSGQAEAVMSDGLIGVTILQGQQFKVASTAPGGAQTTTAAASGGVGLSIVCQLYGTLSRGVQ